MAKQQNGGKFVNPLQAQLMKAGLVKPEQLRRAEQQKRDAVKRGDKPPVVDRAQQQAQLKADADRERNRKRDEQLARKALAAEIRQLVEAHRLDRRGAEAAYQFVDGSKIRKLPVHEAQREQVMKGALAIVRFGGGFELVPPPIAEKIAQRDAGRVVNLTAAADAPTDAADDPYADFPVPDDLMW